MRALQGLLRRAFMGMEALYNRAFGDGHNPFYYLGALTFYLFWIVAGTGLYLYICFDTSVSGAYDSVHALSTRQWFLGGILRSIHRYASDAMVLLMLLHMARYFAYDRLHGFRAFSWITGVVLLWLVYVSAVNGYMLPWDQLAQYVTQTSFEALDWLPGFGGTLSRNFLYPDSISDRFFSLLAFVHIGAPLMVLLLMWVHVQRVPKARTQPPRAIALGTAAVMLGLAVLLPVQSQGGPADLGRAVMTIELDWFVLPVFPLLKPEWLAIVWATLTLLTALLLLLPWISGRRRRAATRWQLLFHPDRRVATARPGETLLEAGLRAGLALPFECRNGACGVCSCSILRGQVEHANVQESALSSEARAQGKALMCCAVALGDVELEVDHPLAAEAQPIRQWRVRVVRMQRYAPRVMGLWLEDIHAERIDFAAGQYFNVILEDGQRRAFSFANPPHDNTQVEMHVRLIEGGRFTPRVFDSMQVGAEFDIEGPLGQFSLQSNERPILFVAGATGFAPVRSILLDCFRRGVQRPMVLYWGVSDPADLYQREQVEQWQREHPNFRLVTVLSAPEEHSDWSGRTGLVHEAILHDYPDLSGMEVYVCGSVQLVDAAVPAFLQQGLSEDACYSDSFLPAMPRA
jgi:NAD(P)H-flavin reductase/quinol-cytochrome oxidoreductase complex cytochrome b subunit